MNKPKLAISNIAWGKEDDSKIYALMREYGFTGLEIAPTRIISENPYDSISGILRWYKDIGFSIPSMQSIWYGRTEKLFGSEDERQYLVDYTKKAIDFASAINCGNLVFGCPKNRCCPDNADIGTAVGFFKEIGDYAFSRNTCIGLEANPPIYGTNFINGTESAIEIIKAVDSEGFRLNLDVGTMIYNDESAELLEDIVHMINHVHISEPGLVPVEERNLHSEIRDILYSNNYRGYISVEMARTDETKIAGVMRYIKGLFYDI